MPAEKAPAKVSPDGHFIEYEDTRIQIPKPIEEMTTEDWVKFSSAPNSPLRHVVIDNQSFVSLHVKLKDPHYMPIWLRDTSRSSERGTVLDAMQRAIGFGAQLISTLDDIEVAAANYQLGADGHIHKDDVVLAKIPKVAYYTMQYQHTRRSNAAIEYQNVVGKAYEGVDMPPNVRGNQSEPLFATTEHIVDYQERVRF